ncbi:MAG: cation:proton antiporter [Ruthenibacterium lactatiformans]
MLFSLAVIFLCGMLLGGLCKKLKLPPLLGMLLTGILLGPHALDVLDGSILAISADLRRIALIIILTRTGLNLELADLKRAGRPAVLLCFVPACFEIAGMVLLAPRLLGILCWTQPSWAASAAVSPAVIVPKMLRLMEEGRGTRAGIPQMIMAGASVDDVFVIVLFTAFTGLADGGGISAGTLARIPFSIVLGILAGAACGSLLAAVFRRLRLRDSAKVLILLSISFLLVTLEDSLSGRMGFSGLIAVVAAGVALQRKRGEVAARLSAKYAKLWVAAELLLFVLVGATVDLRYAAGAGTKAVLLIFLVLLFRMLGVWVCLLRTRLSLRERAFCMLAYCPKATVQAAIGSIPLGMGLACGDIVLTVAVLSILITAPLGAFADCTYQRLLKAACPDSAFPSERAVLFCFILVKNQ